AQTDTFNQATTTVSSNIAGIELGSTNYYAQIAQNRIHDIDNENPSQFGAFGVFLSTSTSNFSNSIVNNALWGITSYGFSTTSLSFDAVGIRMFGGAGKKVYIIRVNLHGW